MGLRVSRERQAVLVQPVRQAILVPRDLKDLEVRTVFQDRTVRGDPQEPQARLVLRDHEALTGPWVTPVLQGPQEHLVL